MLNLAVVVPVRNAQAFITSCLESIRAASPAEMIVVDGRSTDRTVAIAEEMGAQTLSDEGRGVAAARMMGVKLAKSPNVALIDVDIVLPSGALEDLFSEFSEGGYTALQAGLVSTSGTGYWGQALVFHHNNGRSKHWPGLMATIFRKDRLVSYGFDERFRSGEDIEMRWRLKRGKEKVGVSRRTIVEHRFDDTLKCALGQFKDDGEGLARMVLKYKWPAFHLLGIPLAGMLRGIWISLRKLEPKWILYYLVYGVMNYVAIIRTLLTERDRFADPQVNLAMSS